MMMPTASCMQSMNNTCTEMGPGNILGTQQRTEEQAIVMAWKAACKLQHADCVKPFGKYFSFHNCI